jgi:adenine-specific DNA-methyltransferase
LVGDANGADKATQKYLYDHKYKNVNIFCSGEKCRNNLSEWKTHSINVPRNIKGFQFYAAKDREMALHADYGLMIWDGKSVGTILNILRLMQAGKKSVLINVPEKRTVTFRNMSDWKNFLTKCSVDLIKDLSTRVTAQESKALDISEQSNLVDMLFEKNPSSIQLEEIDKFEKRD